MPTAPPTRCGEQGCHEMATTRGRCTDHQRPPWQQRSKAWGKGSTSKWRTARTQQLRREWLCRHCGTKAVEVDHIVPLSQGGSKWDPDNMQSLCGPCHGSKTQEDNAQARTLKKIQRENI
ncbi:HNH endonuclease [Embleya sp. NPDC001921]